ncbi:MAG: hypothetical protein KF860_17325 [Cyclobacteriaceae bacterium]|nr:hypothetical protein [Cyclobacteriaceae bacterium]
MKTEEKKFKPLLIYNDEAGFNKSLKSYNEAAEKFTELASELKSIGVTMKSFDELQACVQEPEKVIRTELVKDEAINLGGLNLNRQKVEALVELPDISHIENLSSRVFSLISGTSGNPNFEQVNVRNLNFKDGVVTVDSNFIEGRRAQFTVWTASEAQNETFEAAMKISEALNASLKLNVPNCSPFNPTRLIRIAGDQFCPDPGVITRV